MSNNAITHTTKLYFMGSTWYNDIPMKSFHGTYIHMGAYRVIIMVYQAELKFMVDFMTPKS